MKNVIGIDLGTTNCCVAIVQDGRPKVIEDDKGYNILPSFIAIKGENKFIVGHGAKAQVISNPTQTLRAVKRVIGRKADSPEVEDARRRMGYEILEGPNLDVLLRIGELTMTPVEASSILLKCIKGIAEKHIGEAVNEAVITCPAYFTNAQRKATIEAGEKAGLKVLRLLNEPTAAALAFGYRKELDKKLLIFDLGGGTFDVSILEVGNNVYEVLATNGDSYLGGEDFDNRVVDHLATEFMARHRVDLRQDKTSLQRLKDAAERAKCELSFVDKAQIMIPHVHGTTNLQTELTRTQLEELTEDLVQRTFEIVTRTLEEANLTASEIDNVILVGGQTRMPRLQELVKSHFGKAPCKGVHPDEAVAIGAAVHADALTEDRGDILLLDVTPFSLGIDSAGDVFTRIVAKNSTIPVAESRTFTTVMDNQEKVKIVVRQGENKRASDNSFLGEFVLTGIRRAPKMEPKIDVVFRIDSNGILNVSAKDRFTGERQSIVIKDYFERATNPDHDAAPVIGEGAGDDAAEPVPEAAAESSGAGLSKAKRLLSRLKGGLRRKKGTKEAGGKEAARDDAAAGDEPADGESVASDNLVEDVIEDVIEDVNALDEVSGDGQSALLAEEEAGADLGEPPPPHPESPSGVDPHGVVPLNEEHLDTLAPDSFSPVSSPEDIEGDDPFAEPIRQKPFTQQYTDPFAAADASTPFARGSGPFSMSGTGADPFSLDNNADVDPFAVQEKVAAGTEADVSPLSSSSSQDSLDAFDLDKLVDELSEGIPDVNPHESDLPVPKEESQAERRSEFSGWKTPALDPELENAFAMAEKGIDPFASDELPAPKDEAAGAHASEAAQGEWADLPAERSSGSNLPSGFVSDVPEPNGAGAASSPPNQKPGRRRKPARLKIAYKRVDAFVREYSENLSRGGTFIKTPSPLDLGRECIFELTIPNRSSPICLNGVVVWSSKGMKKLEDGQEPGMGIKYLFDDPNARKQIERVLDELRVGSA